MKEELVRIENVSKSFGPTKALKHVDLIIRRGTIHGFIGENGSGKSTLSSIVSGQHTKDEGSGPIYVRGMEYEPHAMIDAQQWGIAMIVQERGTIPGLTVAENIFVGREKEFHTFGLVDKKKMEAAAQVALDKIGEEHIKPYMQIDALNFEQQKIVEIARALCEDPEVLIVDETTTALSEYGRQILFNIMYKIRDHGGAVLFITHDLDEMMDVCTNVTILRDGEIITSLEKEEMELNKLRELMVGRQVDGQYYRADAGPSWDDEVILSIQNVTDSTNLMNFSAEVHKGEILGIGGLTECGMHELGQMVFGVTRPLTGSIMFLGTRIQGNCQTAISRGMGYVSKNRDVDALILNTSIRNNIALPSLKELRRKGFITQKSEMRFADQQIDALRIKTESGEKLVSQLSGGNKQKVVLGKWLGKDIKCLVMDCPTRGVDIGVKAAIYQIMIELKNRGVSIILISEELPELMGMSDRLIILKNGRISKEFLRSAELTDKEIIHYMI